MSAVFVIFFLKGLWGLVYGLLGKYVGCFTFPFFWLFSSLIELKGGLITWTSGDIRI